MAQFVPPVITMDDVFRITWFGRLDNQRIMWVLNARCVDNTVNEYITAMQDLADSLALNMQGTTQFGFIRALQSDEFLWEEVRVQRIHPTRDIYVSSDISTTGSEVDPAAPPNIALSVTNRTALPGEHGVGRQQLCGFPASLLDEGLWDVDLASDVEGALNLTLTSPFVATTTTNEYRFGVLGVFAADVEIQDIIQCVSHLTVRTMHRRTVGLGE